MTHRTSPQHTLGSPKMSLSIMWHYSGSHLFAEESPGSSNFVLHSSRENFLFQNSSRQPGMDPSWSRNLQKLWANLQRDWAPWPEPIKKRNKSKTKKQKNKQHWRPRSRRNTYCFSFGFQQFCVLEAASFVACLRGHFEVFNVSSWFAFVCNLSSTWWLVSITHFKGEGRILSP